MDPKPRWLTATPFAHRGLHDSARPENSLAAVEAAIRAGYPVEIDVQPTSDGEAVVFHDWNLRRLTGRDMRVALVARAELAPLRLLDTTERIPLLREVLDLVAGQQPLVIELKNRRQPGLLEPAVSRLLRNYPGPCAIHSFNPFTLGWFRRHHSDLLRGQISCAFDTDGMAGWKKAILEHYGMNWMSRPHFISHQLKRLPAAVPLLLRRLGKPLLAWTITGLAEQRHAQRWADNYFFEGFTPDL